MPDIRVCVVKDIGGTYHSWLSKIAFKASNLSKIFKKNLTLYVFTSLKQTFAVHTSHKCSSYKATTTQCNFAGSLNDHKERSPDERTHLLVPGVHSNRSVEEALNHVSFQPQSNLRIYPSFFHCSPKVTNNSKLQVSSTPKSVGKVFGSWRSTTTTSSSSTQSCRDDER